MTKALKRAASVFLAILLLFVAFAAPITQPVKAVAVSAVVISAVLAAMAVWGISTITAGMTAADIQDWVSTKLNEWANSQSSTVSSLIPISGISVTTTALLVLGNAAANGVKSFVNWLSNDETLVPGQTINVSRTISKFGGVDMTYSQNFDYWYYTPSTYIKVISYSGQEVYICGERRTSPRETFTINMYSLGPFAYYLAQYDDNGDLIESTIVNANGPYNGYYYNLDNIGIRYTVTSNGNTYYNSPEWVIYDNAIPEINVNTGVTIKGKSLDLKTDVSYNLPVDLTQPESLYLNTGAAIGATLEGVTDHVITGVIENTLDVTGTIAEEAPPYEVTGPVQVPGIKDIFPFCIPFDLYAFLACLAAEPEAPAFTWRIYVPGIVDEEIEVDLAPFNTVATILRTGLLLLFCVGLAFETRKLLRS